MKKKPVPTPSSTQTSFDSGKARLKKIRLRAVENEVRETAQRFGSVEEKMRGLMSALSAGDLPEGVVIQSLIKSQRANAEEINEIKIYVAKMMRGVGRLEIIPDQLTRLDNTMLMAIERVRELKLLLKPTKGSHGNKGKRKRKPAARPD